MTLYINYSNYIILLFWEVNLAYTLILGSTALNGVSIRQIYLAMIETENITLWLAYIKIMQWNTFMEFEKI